MPDTMERLSTRDEARDMWRESGLGFADLTPARIRGLRKRINAEMVKSGLIDGTYRCHQRAKIQRGTTGGDVIEIKCRSRYFDDRQAITIEKNGFVGFAGWADATNIRPVLDGFASWMAWMVRENGERNDR